MSAIRAQGRLKGRKPIAVIDIGSNSVRLVIYEGLVRSPTVLFNEKILCGLGRGIAINGKLESSSVDIALRTLKRFRALCEQLEANDIHVLATAASREAKNGPQFIKSAEKILGVPINVLTGTQEAEYCANGVISSFYKPEGLIGDLGGGSLELVAVKNTKIGGGVTLPLGGIRLQDMSSNNLAEASRIAKTYLKKSVVLEQCKGQKFYAVGGTWRNLAKLYMNVIRYPLPVMHAYEVDAKELIVFLQMVAEQDINDIPGISAISKNRRQLLSYGIAVLTELFYIMAPKTIVFSGAGVREGFLYTILGKKVQKQDPLIAAADEMTVLRARSPKHALELIEWTQQAFQLFKLDETENERRYREAACLLSDIDWRVHPDYRGNQASTQIAYGGYPGIDHLGRVFIALTIFFRNQGISKENEAPPFISLATPKIVERAKILGAIMRVANAFCTSTAGILSEFRWKKQKKGAILVVPKIHRSLIAERPVGRLQQLSKLVNIPLKYTIGK